jgi:para-nitrobenzyl esterase
MTAGTTVQIDSGALEGSTAAGVTQFLGIPYAAPPVGPLRWRPPEPVAPWRHVLQAVQYGPDSLQGAQSMVGSQRASEDCLYLNLWIPVGATDSLPVMLFIHGGGFNVGSGSLAAYNGSCLARLGVVVVTINYRLGKLGFLAHPALAAEQAHEFSGNYGIMDMIAALQWVQRNIASFGGDPGNVTIFGESAGGMAVHYLMTSRRAEGLFHKAIVQSGGGRMPIQSMEAGLAAGTVSAQAWGDGIADAARLRAVPAATVLGDGGIFAAAPMIDGTLIPEPPLEAFDAGRMAIVPYMIGANSFETGFFPGMAKGTLDRLGTQRAEAEQLYDGYGTGRVELIEEQVMGDIMMVAPARSLARAASYAGLPTWLYHFDWLRPAQRGVVPGARHVDEIYALFGTFDALVGPDGQVEDNDPAVLAAITQAMQSRWVAFARAGNPDHGWPRFDPEEDRILEFTSDGPVVCPDPRARRLDFIDRLPTSP